jgi:hypothetical protein
VEKLWLEHLYRSRGVAPGPSQNSMASDKRLAPGEAFILLTAAYLHDIGMQNEQFAGGDIE